MNSPWWTCSSLYANLCGVFDGSWHLSRWHEYEWEHLFPLQMIGASEGKRRITVCPPISHCCVCRRLYTAKRITTFYTKIELWKAASSLNREHGFSEQYYYPAPSQEPRVRRNIVERMRWNMFGVGDNLLGFWYKSSSMYLGGVRSCVFSDMTKIASIMSYKFQAMKQINANNRKIQRPNHTSQQ